MELYTSVDNAEAKTSASSHRASDVRSRKMRKEFLDNMLVRRTSPAPEATKHKVVKMGERRDGRSGSGSNEA